jgi:hypothetical protein
MKDGEQGKHGGPEGEKFLSLICKFTGDVSPEVSAGAKD